MGAVSFSDVDLQFSTGFLLFPPRDRSLARCPPPPPPFLSLSLGSQEKEGERKRERGSALSEREGGRAGGGAALDCGDKSSGGKTRSGEEAELPQRGEEKKRKSSAGLTLDE